MGQSEVLDWFILKRVCGLNGWWTFRDVQNELGIPYDVARRNVQRLYLFGYLDIKHEKGWRRYYRVKEKYLDTHKHITEPISTANMKNDINYQNIEHSLIDEIERVENAD